MLNRLLLFIFILLLPVRSFAAFPITSILDSFNRANEGPPPSASWGGRLYSSGFQFKVSSNALILENGSANGDSKTDYWGASFSADQEAYITVSTKSTNVSQYPIWFDMRMQTPGTSGLDGYEVAFFPVAGAANDTIQMYRIDNESFTTLGGLITQEVSAGDSVGVSVIGSTITVWYKASAGSWTSLGTQTDATYGSAGYIGIGAADTTSPTWVLDNFGGGSISSSRRRVTIAN